MPGGEKNGEREGETEKEKKEKRQRWREGGKEGGREGGREGEGEGEGERERERKGKVGRMRPGLLNQNTHTKYVDVRILTRTCIYTCTLYTYMYK